MNNMHLEQLLRVKVDGIIIMVENRDRKIWLIVRKMNRRVRTSMRKEGEWRTLQRGSPRRSVKRESVPLGPTSHIFSTASTLPLSLFGSNSLITNTPLPDSSPILLLPLAFCQTSSNLTNYDWNTCVNCQQTLGAPGRGSSLVRQKGRVENRSNNREREREREWWTDERKCNRYSKDDPSLPTMEH